MCKHHYLIEKYDICFDYFGNRVMVVTLRCKKCKKIKKKKYW